MTMISPTVSIVRGPNNTRFEHVKHPDGAVFTVLMDQLGFEIVSVEGRMRPGETGFADAICRNQDSIFDKMNWEV